MNLKALNLTADFDRAFPKKESKNFLERAAQNWKNLMEERIEKEDYYAAILYFQLKTKKYKLDKFYVFILWLILCVKRPWEKGWKFSLSEKDLNEISSLLEKIIKDFPELPDLPTLRKYWRREKFKEDVALTTLVPMLSKLKEPFKDCFEEILKNLKPNLWEIVFKFIDEISSQRYYTKRDLMRKLRISKDQFDLILKWAEDRDLIKHEKFPQGSVFITWNEPPKKHEKSINNL